MNYLKELETFGYCIVSTGEINEHEFIQFANQFGDIQSHLRANTSGVTSLKAGLSNDAVSNEYELPDMMPHTDGPYLSIPYQINSSKVIRLDPPMLVLFYCQQVALNHGETILIDMQEVLKDFFSKNPESEEILKKPGCIVFIKGSLFSGELPFLEKFTTHRYRIRFRVDPQSLVADWAYEKVNSLITFIRDNKKYHRIVPLKNGEVLIFDNYRMLHGRNSFTESSKIPRILKRIWIANNSPQQLYRIDEVGSIQTTVNSESYRPFITRSNVPNRISSLDLGIKGI